MMRVLFAPTALLDLERLRDFLRPKNPAAAKRAAQVIVKTIQILERNPQIGRSVEGMDDLAYRELPIDFGDSGYVARYRLTKDVVIVVAVRHQREAGF
jgi:plasmid stabilization system protein ParE